MATHRSDETEEQTPSAHGTGSTPAARLQLRVAGTRGIQTFPLPPAGSLVIGRAPGVEVRIEEGSISRRHAVLHIGRTIQLEDLGSSNGSRVRGQPVEPGARVDVQAGDVVELGKVLCLLEGRASGERPGRIWSHGYFEARVEDECARAAASHAPFAVLRVRVEAVADAAFEADLLAAVRPMDVVALYVPGDYEVLRVETPAELAASAAAALAAQLRAPRGDEREGRTVRVGVACHPRDGRSPETLLGRASELLRPPAAAEPRAGPDGGAIVVEDPAMVRLHGLLARVAEGTINVLLLGETGVGKEVFAERIHARSPRAAGPFLQINCAAFADALFESELFGHEKGAFTGAAATKAGLLETASGGTVFLDEVGELSLSLQAKLLRVIEERQVRRVGGLKSRPIDARLVAATNRDLEAEIATGRFRADLYFRLNGISLVIPPLRERPAEIAPLARRFVALACQQAGRGAPPALSPEALALLQRYRWPGNIRELRNMMERAVLLSGGEAITPEHLPVEKMGTVVPRPSVLSSADPAGSHGAPPLPLVPAAPGSDLLRTARDLVEREHIVEALGRCGGNQTKTAALLGISRRALVSKLGTHNLPRPRKRPAG